MEEKKQYKYVGDYSIVLYSVNYAGRVSPGDVVLLTGKEVEDLGGHLFVKVTEKKKTEDKVG